MNPAKLILVSGNIPVFAVMLYTLSCYRFLPKELKVIACFIFLSCVVQSVSWLLWINRLNNLFLSHFYVAAGFFCLALFYEKILHGFVDRKIIRVSTYLFVGFSVVNTLFIQKLNVFNSNALTVESILVIILSLSTYIFLLEKRVRESRQSILKSIYWINSGLFIYFSSSLLLFYYGELLMHYFPINLSRYTWILHAFFSSIMYLCFFIALWKRPRN